MGLLLLTIVLMGTLVIVPDMISAAGKKDQPVPPTEGTPSKTPKKGLSSSTNTNNLQTQSTMYLKSWESSISSLSGNIVRVGGFTESYSSVDTIAVQLFLQYWDGEKWVDEVNVGEFKNSNTTYVDGSDRFTVSSGFYYRVRGVHYIINDGLTERVNSYTSFIYVN